MDTTYKKGISYSTSSEVCASCKSTDWKLINPAHMDPYLRCNKCNYHIQAPSRDTNRLDQFEAAQNKNYQGEALCNSELFRFLGKSRLAGRLRLLKKYIPTGRVIEVGPGAGDMLSIALKNGYEVEAVEHSRSLSDRIIKKFNIEVKCGEFEKLEITKNFYDAFLSFHVIEHVTDVHAHLKQANSIVKPGGYAIIATPSADSWEHNSPFGLSPNYSAAHLQLLSRDSAKMLLEKNGWQVVKITTPSYAEYWVRSITSLIRLIKSKRRTPTIARGGFAGADEKSTRRQILVLKAITILTYPLRKLQEAIGSGNELLIVAQKRVD